MDAVDNTNTNDVPTLDDPNTDPTTDDAGTSPAPQTLEQRIAGVTDGSRLSPELDADGLAALIERNRETGRNAVKLTTAAETSVAKWAAADCAVRSEIILPNGFPDWGAATELYTEITTVAYAPVREGMDSRKWNNLSSARRMAVKRTQRELAIRDFVAGEQTHSDDPEVRKAHLAEVEKDATLLTVFNARVKEHYRAAKTSDGKPLAIPARYLSPEEQEAAKSGRTPRDPASALATATGSMEALKEQVIPRFAVMVLLRGVSYLVARISAKDAGAIEDRAHVGATLDRIADIAVYGSRVCGNTATEGDREAYVSSAWGTEDEQYK